MDAYHYTSRTDGDVDAYGCTPAHPAAYDHVCRAAISNANANVNPYTNANGNAATDGDTGANHPRTAGSDGYPASAVSRAHLLRSDVG